MNKTKLKIISALASLALFILILGFMSLDQNTEPHEDPIYVTDDPEPKDPGEEGNRTLLGIDSDNDGVRDDIEIWINKTYPNTITKNRYNYRMLFKQAARSYQKTLEFKDDIGRVIDYKREGFDAIECLNYFSILKENDSRQQRIMMIKNSARFKDFYSIFFNTKMRIQEEIKSREYFHGSTLVPPKKTNNGCYFEVQ